MPTRDAFVAQSRFGLGPRPGDLVGHGARARLHAAIGRAVTEPDLDALSHTRDLLAHAFQAIRAMNGKVDRKTLRHEARDVYQHEAAVHAEHTARSDDPLRERMVWYWTNHFTVSATKAPVLAFGHAFEREAIRPHLWGRFEDMLLAVVRHPAMLAYLDNARSTGPHSPAGLRRGLGLNENLGRELMELHTLGVHGGYDQADVEALAAILTGWGIDREGRSKDGFQFSRRRHEPGEKTLLGKRYGEGYAEGERALRALARHPSTAKHVATRLCKHFVADEPPPEAIDRVARAFSRSGGDLRAVTRAVIDEPTAWKTPLARLRQPRDLVIATARALGLHDGTHLVRAMRLLGQPPVDAPSPAGWHDEDAAWAGPEAVMERVELAHLVASRVPVADPVSLAHEVLGPVMSPATLHAVRSATDPRTGLLLLLASPEFQRR